MEEKEIRIMDMADNISTHRIVCTCGQITIASKKQRHVNCFWCSNIIDVELELQNVKDKQISNRLAEEE